MRKMKDSGVEWIGEIPEDWEVRKVKFCGSLFASGVDKKTIDGEKLYKSVHYMDIYKNSLKFIGNSDNYLIISEKDEKAASATLEEGDVLLTNSSETPEDIGHSAVVIEPLIDTLMGYHLMRFRPYIKINFAFEKYLFGSHLMRTWFSYRAYGMTRYGLSYNDFASANLILPPVEKQDCIADFLDRKCAQIDAIIAKQQAVIEKLKLYKQSVITEAVTKGLDPDAPMKDSGIEWIGKIPAHWGVNSIMRIATVVRGASPRPAGDSRYFNGKDVPWITVAEVTKNDDKYLYNTESFLTTIGASKSRYIESGILLLSNSGATLGVPKITRIAGCINDGSVALYDLKINQEFLYYVLKSRTQELRKQMQGYGQPNLNTSIIKSIDIPIPGESEQNQIVNLLNVKHGSIVLTIQKKQTLIDKLTQYKKSLIYEAVTGKLEV